MMKHLVLFSVAAGLVCAEPLEAILGRMDAAAKATTSFSASVKWDQFTKSINDHSEQTGSIRLMRSKGRVTGRMDVEKPAAYTWHFAGDNFEKFLPKAKSLEVYKVSKLLKSADQYLALAFGLTGQELRKTYDITAGAEETIGTTRATRLELIPKDKKAREYAAKVELWVAVGQTYAVQQKVTEPNGNYNLYIYNDAKLNPELPDSAFDFTPPAGTERRVMN